MTYCKISLKNVPMSAKYPDYQNAAFKSLFSSLKVKPTLALSRAAFKQESVKYSAGSSISGVQQKLSMAVNDQHELVPVSEGGHYILKPSPEEFPNVSENEHTAMLTSALLDIPTAQCGLVSFADNELVYITRRFDRVANGRKLHQEDLVQGFAMQSDDKYSRSYEEAGELVSKMTNGKQAVVLDYLHRIMHAYLIGNDDMHLKNTSLQRARENTSPFYDRLTPNYDSLFTGIFENHGAGSFLALDLLSDGFSEQYEHYGFYTGHDFLNLAERLQIRDKPIRSFARKIENKMPALLTAIANSYMPDEAKATASDMLLDRLPALLIGI